MNDVDAKLKDQILNGTAPLNSTPRAAVPCLAFARCTKMAKAESQPCVGCQEHEADNG